MYTTHLLYLVGGTLELDLLTRPATSQTVRVINGAGAEVLAATAATLSTVNTTLSSAASAGATSIVVALATGITAGVEFWLRSPSEKVRCKSISGTTVTLWSPLLYAHASSTTVEGTRLTYAVGSSSGACASLYWDGRAEWIIDGSINTYTSVECTKYPLTRFATTQDLVNEQPKLYEIIEAETDCEKLLDLGHDDVLKAIGANARVRVYTGSREFIGATVFAAFARFYRRQLGALGGELYARYQDAFEREIKTVTAYVPRDGNQDGTVTAPEKVSVGQRRVVRC